MGNLVLAVENAETDFLTDNTEEESFSETEEKSMYFDADFECFTKYHNGQMTKEDYALYVIDRLKNYIKSRIKKKNRLAGGEFEDFMQAAYLAVLSKFQDFDPRRGTMTTYFTKDIDSAMKRSCNNSMSAYYVGKCTELDRVARENGFEDMLHVPPDTLSVLSGVPLTTVLETMKNKHRKIESINNNLNSLELTESHFRNPEDAMIEKENKEFLSSELLKCSPFEQYLLHYLYIADDSDKKSYRRIVKMLKHTPFREKFKEENFPENIDQKYLEIRVNRVLNKLRRSAGRKKMFYEFKSNDSYELVEQASSSDFEDAIISGVFENL